MTAPEPHAERHDALPQEDPQVSSPGGDAQKALEEFQAKADSYLNNWRRTQADLENLRKRTEQEKQETTLWAGANVLSALLPVIDDFTRALDAIDASQKKEKWFEGLSLVYKKLLTSLEAQGLTVIPTTGQPFDPKLHDAVMKVDGEEGTVVMELQKGYRFRDRVLRPAFVAVGNGVKRSRGADAPEKDAAG
jgi:molecular chaperone GrpE